MTVRCATAGGLLKGIGINRDRGGLTMTGGQCLGWLDGAMYC